MLDYRKSQPGDHAPAECAKARGRADELYAGLTAAYRRSVAEWSAMRDEYDHQTGGYHAGWGICSGRVAAPAQSPFTRRALAGELPAKATAR